VWHTKTMAILGAMVTAVLVSESKAGVCTSCSRLSGLQGENGASGLLAKGKEGLYTPVRRPGEREADNEMLMQWT